MEDKESKPVYVGTETDEPIPARNIGRCIGLSGILVLTVVCLIVIWSVTR